MSGEISALCGCFIDAREVVEGEFYTLIDPSTGEAFARSVAAEERLVDAALQKAREALPKWRSTDAAHRASVLHALAGGLRRDEETLGLLICREMGKTLPAARAEVRSAASLMDYFAEEGLRIRGEIPLLGFKRERVLVVREPVGVVGAITPFNYPLSTLVCKLGPALAAGCTIVAKPDECSPLSTVKVAHLAVQAGLPPGVFNVVTGTGPGAGRLLVEHPVPRLITFTGSRSVGKEVMASSGKWVRKVILELGGHCPAIVAADAPWRDFLPAVVNQSMKNSGQYCYRISRIYVAEKMYAEFLAALKDLIERLRVGPADAPGVDVGPLSSERALLRLRAQVDEAVKEGARIETGGASPAAPARGYYYSPTVLTGVLPGMAIAGEEIFGPVVIVNPVKDMEEAVREANGTPYGLAAYLFSANLPEALEWADRLEVGSVWVNRIHQACNEAPFGGVKESGLGREKSHFGIEEYTELKTIYMSY